MDIVEAVAATRQPGRAALFVGAASSEEAACDGAIATHDCCTPPMDTVKAAAASRQSEEIACDGVVTTHDC